MDISHMQIQLCTPRESERGTWVCTHACTLSYATSSVLAPQQAYRLREARVPTGLCASLQKGTSCCVLALKHVVFVP